jgi:[acyl-carrier-protein] S-malonyltransferase
LTSGIPIIPNVTRGEVVTEYNAGYLIDQIVGPVHWLQTFEAAHPHGIDVFLDLGPKNILYNLARKTATRSAVKICAWKDIHAAIDALDALRNG